ncbi:LOW QUALITY PROTEIN: 52 kDa repressor of the inhibitor of the protein kinase-like, partial [Lasioglossum baleicum]|uniref:LOW QUALITY PROTEIN: 52 kDa repressor of the inhibitor of the protein kinase-like n=1 Tax=Lasioglossum baleicum TaxID=434251 RepID=UPI003FCDBAB4
FATVCCLLWGVKFAWFCLQGDSKGKGDGSGGLKRSLKKIDSFFPKKPRLEIAHSKNSPTTTTDENNCIADASAFTATLPTLTVDEEKTCSPVTNDIQPTICTSTSDSDQIKTSLSQPKFASDIACYIGENIDDSTKAMLLEKHWQPAPNYTFPHCVVNKKGKQTKKYAQKSHLDKFHWLVLSHKDQGLYCKYCKKATDAINDTLSVLQNKRENVDVIYRQLFEEAKEVAEQLHVEIKCPRIVSKQIHRANNQPAQSAEEYFRRAIYIPLLDSIISDLQDRLSPDVLNLFQLSVFMPKSEYSNEDIETVKQLATDYTLLLDNTPVSVIVNEYRLWMVKWQAWQRSQDIPQSISDLILNCDIDMYPNIRKFLCIMATLPVSVATAERFFSTLRRIKSWLRSSMVEDRLTGLALLHVHKNVPIDVNDVITRFGRRRKRNIDFVI